MAKQKIKNAEAYRLPNPLVYRLSNPNYTIYHRAALGGLAATARAWGQSPPEGIKAEVQRDSVTLSWDEDLTDQEALRRVIEASFKRTGDKLIDLPGQQIDADREDLRLAIHNGIVGSFLQHNKMRPGEKAPRFFELRVEGEETGSVLSYKAVDSYAHQKAQKTGLLDEKSEGGVPQVGAIPQWIIPGATGGARELQAPAEEVFLLMFLMVGCAIFLLRPRTFQEKAQACVIVPDVVDLVAFAKVLERIASSGSEMRRFSNTYLGRVVGGAEEAALRFLIDLQAAEVAERKCVAGCIAIAMGKVAWDANQINRSVIARLQGDYEELNVFRAANQYLGVSKAIRLKSGESYVIPASPVPELVAANLAAERHWCAHFKSLVAEKKDFERMLYSTKGLQKMKEAVKNEDDQVIIRVFHEAWRRTMAEIYGRARREGLNEKRLLEVEREKMRNSILRAKTADALAGWFLRFCADATKGGPLKTMREESERVRRFIFNPRNFDRFQNICLFALISYASEEPQTATEGAY